MTAARRRRTAVSAARLMEEAELARDHSHSPYSEFAVGAALLTRDGRIVRGCNVENASFGLSMCAERNAVWTAVGAGARDFVAIAVTAGPSRSASPCGACRQVLHEFAPKLRVHFRDGRRIVTRRLDQMLPFGFDLEAARGPAPRRAARRRKVR